MPVENELKYVLDLQFADDLSEKNVDPQMRLLDAIRMRQGYLCSMDGMNVRIREEIYNEGNIADPVFTLTVKRKVDGEVIEIETEISDGDFVKLWSVCSNKLIKERLVFCPAKGTSGPFQILSGDVWEVDLFYTESLPQVCYFVQAEHEMDASQDAPEYIPDLIQHYLVYAVPREESGAFGSRNLAEVEYAKALYEKLCAKKKPG